MPFSESNITLNFPDSNFFRFCDCKGYTSIQDNLAEMDACWYNSDEDILYVIELKDWRNNRLIEEDDSSYSKEKIDLIKKKISESRINVLLKKSIDSTCMFISVLLNNTAGINIGRCMPFKISKDTKIKLLSIINWSEADDVYISHINTEYKSKFKPYAKLFGIKSYLVVTKSKAAELLTWIN